MEFLELSRAHPYGVRPRGDLWSAAAAGGGSGSGSGGGGRSGGRRSGEKTSRGAASRARGLGPRLALLADGLLLSGALSMLGGGDLARLSRASRFAYALAHHDALWRHLVLGALAGGDLDCLDYRGSWKETFARGCGGGGGGGSAGAHVPVRCGSVFSDALYQSFWCAAQK